METSNPPKVLTADSTNLEQALEAKQDSLMEQHTTSI